MDKNIKDKFKELDKLLAKAEKLSEKFIKKENINSFNVSTNFDDNDVKIYEPKRKNPYSQYKETQFEDFKKSEE